MVKKSEYFLIRIGWIGRAPPPLLTESKKKNSFFMPPLTSPEVVLVGNVVGVVNFVVGAALVVLEESAISDLVYRVFWILTNSIRGKNQPVL